jgi:hypothetical protein
MIESGRSTLLQEPGPESARAGRPGWVWLMACAAVILVTAAVIAALELMRRNAFNGGASP